jgi:hypothetical protein
MKCQAFLKENPDKILTTKGLHGLPYVLAVDG